MQENRGGQPYGSTNRSTQDKNIVFVIVGFMVVLGGLVFSSLVHDGQNSSHLPNCPVVLSTATENNWISAYDPVHSWVTIQLGTSDVPGPSNAEAVAIALVGNNSWRPLSDAIKGATDNAQNVDLPQGTLQVLAGSVQVPCRVPQT